MINDFIEVINDSMRLEDVSHHAYVTDPDPMAPATRGQLSSEVALAMQYGVRAQQDQEEETEELKGKITALEEIVKTQGSMITDLLKKGAKSEQDLANALGSVTRLARELAVRGFILDQD